MLISEMEDQLHTFNFYALEWGLLFRKISTYLMPLKVRRSARGSDSVYYGRSREYPPPTSKQAKWIRVPRGFY
jgi:hypothetical protein